MPVEEYRQERVAELGEFLGNVIAGIYDGIRNGAADNESHFAAAAGRAHQSWAEYFGTLKSGVRWPPAQRRGTTHTHTKDKR